jgi:hypothetical protein
MFQLNSKTYKLIPSVQIIDDIFTTGYVVEILDQYGALQSTYFTDRNKAVIIEDIKRANGFKTKASKLIDQLLEEDI